MKRKILLTFRKLEIVDIWIWETLFMNAQLFFSTNFIQIKMQATANNDQIIKRPSMFWLLTEAGRALTEFGMSVPYRGYSKRFCKNGDGHPVLVLPGFMASDTSTSRLRQYISNMGYTSLKWDLGRNYGKEETIDMLLDKLEELFDLYGEKISLVGWSLGGVYARQLAKAHPDKIRQVITLGSPFRGISEANNVAWIYNLLTGGRRVTDVDPLLLADLPNPAPVPTTAVYSKQDGIVPWQVCMEAEETLIHQNVEVRSSHLGLGVNPSVLKIIGDRLQYSAVNWRHFTPGNFMEDLLLYPSL
ncbi:MAG: putative esterase [Paraglaciecola sp.]